IAEESGVANTVDPLGGSYFLEALTDRVEADARAILEKIDAMGGIVAAIEAGYPQKEIADAAYRYQQQVDRAEKTIVGVNRYRSESDTPIEILRIPMEVEISQKKSLASRKASRDNRRVQSDLEAITRTAVSGGNLMPAILDAVRHYATVGEIC